MKTLNFDWTINLGHVLTFIGFILTLGVMAAKLDSRITVIEQVQIFQTQRDTAQDRALSDTKSEIKDALRDVHGSLEKLADKLDAVKGDPHGRH